MTVREMAFLCALLPMAPGAERGTAVVRGRVTSTADGLAIRDEAVKRTTSDAAGRFSLPRLPPGDRHLDF